MLNLGTDIRTFGLPNTAVVAYAYSPRERNGAGAFHIMLSAPFELGRIRRSEGDTLCGRSFWGLDKRNEKQYGVTCKRCLEIASRTSVKVE